MECPSFLQAIFLAVVLSMVLIVGKINYDFLVHGSGPNLAKLEITEAASALLNFGFGSKAATDQLRGSSTAGEAQYATAVDGDLNLVNLQRQLSANGLSRLNEVSSFLQCEDAGQAKLWSSMQLNQSFAAVLALSPTFPCLWTLEKFPSARKASNGWWGCGLQELSSRSGAPCRVYGAGGDVELEKRATELSEGPCEVHLLGKRDEKAEVNPKWKEHQVQLGSEGGKSLEAAMRELGHQYVDVLKLPGDAAGLLEETDWSKAPVGQLLVEVNDESTLRTLAQWSATLQKLAKAGFLLTAAEPSTNPKQLGLHRLTFLQSRWTPGTPPPTAGYGELFVTDVTDPALPSTALQKLQSQLNKNSAARTAEAEGFSKADAWGSKTVEHPPTALLLLAPSFPCLWTLDKSPSISQKQVGGLWTCGLAELGRRPADAPCIVYSFGSKGEDVFEERVQELSNGKCSVHVFDPALQQDSPEMFLKLNRKWKFASVGLGASEGILTVDHGKRQSRLAQLPLAAIMKNQSHTYVDLMKISIPEKQAWEVLAAMDWSKAPVGQLLLELYDHGERKMPVLLEELQRLRKAGYQLFASEPNAYTHAHGMYVSSWVHSHWEPSRPPPPEGYGTG